MPFRRRGWRTLLINKGIRGFIFVFVCTCVLHTRMQLPGMRWLRNGTDSDYGWFWLTAFAAAFHYTVT